MALKVAIFGLPPFVYKSASGGIDGCEVELAEILAQALETSLQWVPVGSWNVSVNITCIPWQPLPYWSN